MGLKLDGKILIAVLFVTTLSIVVNGATTDVSLGDESHHYGFARNIYEAGRRVAFDPVYESGNPPGFFYNDPPLWHLAVAWLWRIAGSPSQLIAQLFQGFFFALLLWVTYQLSKESMGGKQEWVPVMLIGTVPMVVSFSTLLYMDVPMTSLSALSFLLLLKRRYLGAGIASSLAFFTKLNAAFFFPGFFLTILLNGRKGFWHLAKRLFQYFLPIAAIYVPDRQWRMEHIPRRLDHLNVYVVASKAITAAKGAGATAKDTFCEYFNSYLTNPVDIVKYFGIALLVLGLLYFVRISKRGWNFVLCVPIMSYVISFLFLFGVRSDIRYLLPIVPLLVCLTAPGWLELGRGFRILIAVLCIMQFVSTGIYVREKRQIPPPVKEGFEYVRDNVSRESTILYPEENLLLYARKKMVWSSIRNARPGQHMLYTLLWTENQREMIELLNINGIDHILIKKSRVYSRTDIRHTGGYPRSFLERLSRLDGWEKVFENSELALWKMKN